MMVENEGDGSRKNLPASARTSSVAKSIFQISDELTKYFSDFVQSLRALFTLSYCSVLHVMVLELERSAEDLIEIKK